IAASPTAETVTIDAGYHAGLLRLAAIAREHPELVPPAPPDPVVEADLAASVADGRILPVSVQGWRAPLAANPAAWAQLAALVPVVSWVVTLSSPVED